MAAYYNEFDPQAAQWLRNLIAAGLIAPGDVDERSIVDVRADDLRGYTQHHFFAGIGVWSYALRRAGWGDDRPVWTGSCPCQPFSAAGVQAGFADERHLWPHFFRLIQEFRPSDVLGEQVASKAAEHWIDLVQADLEAVDYAFGGIAFPSAGVGAPHIRDRFFWVGHTDNPGLQGHAGNGGAARRQGPGGSVAPAGVSGGVAHSTSSGRREERPVIGGVSPGDREEGHTTRPVPGSAGGGMADADGGQLQEARRKSLARVGQSGVDEAPGPTGPANGFWSDADWLFLRDGKWRPVEPGTFPLAHGLARSMGTLRPELRELAELAGLDADSLAGAKDYRIVSLKGYGNAINAEAATRFVEAYLDARGELDGRADLIEEDYQDELI